MAVVDGPRAEGSLALRVLLGRLLDRQTTTGPRLQLSRFCSAPVFFSTHYLDIVCGTDTFLFYSKRVSRVRLFELHAPTRVSRQTTWHL